MDPRLTSAFWTLRIAFGLTAFLAGLDKFLNLLTSWTDYINPVVLQLVPLDPEMLIRAIGIVEIAIGLAILTRWTRIGAYAAALWLVVLAVNLASMQRFLDVAVRDLLLAACAFALARLTEVRQADMVVETDAREWEASPREILTLKL